MMKWLILAALVACACPSKQAGTGTGTGTGMGSGSQTTAEGGCDAVRPKVEQLYRAEAQAKEPKRVDEAVADNTTMVMNDCAKDPATVSACLASATTVADIETKCLERLAPEGTETKGFASTAERTAP